MSRYLLDTNIVSQEQLATASVVWHELLFGCHRLPASERRVARWHATERARLALAGRTPPFADGQIAAIAKTNDLILITLNLADYAGFHDLQIEDWQA